MMKRVLVALHKKWLVDPVLKRALDFCCDLDAPPARGGIRAGYMCNEPAVYIALDEYPDAPAPLCAKHLTMRFPPKEQP